MTFVVATFYQFVALPDCHEIQPLLQQQCNQQALRGTILLAAEGINATIAGSESGIDSILSYLRSDPRLANLQAKFSEADSMPFDRMKVRVKREIVTLGRSEADPNRQVGTYVEPQDWNALISDPDVVVIDTRNQYEVKIGTFVGAENPGLKSFRDFPAYAQQLDPTKHQKIAMFCTGGIRCEKASSFLLAQGFNQVFHLKGGILKYLETVPAEQSLWQGECFVFDQRVAVQQGLESGTHEMCLSCGHPLSAADRSAPEYEAGISCPHCFAELTEEKRRRQSARNQSRSSNAIESPAVRIRES